MSDDIFDPENLDLELTELMQKKVDSLHEPIQNEIILNDVELSDFKIDRKFGGFILELSLPESARNDMADIIRLKKHRFSLVFLPKDQS